MAVTTTVKNVVGRVLLDNGTTTSGTVRTINQSLGTMNPKTWDSQKAYNIAVALAPCLSKNVTEINQVVTSSIQE